MQSAQHFDAFTKPNVRSAAGHIRCHGHRAAMAGQGNDFRLALEMLRAKDFVRDVLLRE